MELALKSPLCKALPWARSFRARLHSLVHLSAALRVAKLYRAPACCWYQAQVYFPKALYQQLQDALISFGESRLGCRAITPIWMSYYVDGMSQQLHCDRHAYAALRSSRAATWGGHVGRPRGVVMWGGHGGACMRPEQAHPRRASLAPRLVLPQN
jgi:hypothetical protein